MRAVTGFRAWLVQRISAVYLLVFTLIGAVYFAAGGAGGFEAWRTFMGHPAVSIATALFFVALLAHAWVGVRDVIMDYIPVLALRVALLTIVATWLLGMAVWALRVLVSTG